MSSSLLLLTFLYCHSLIFIWLYTKDIAYYTLPPIVLMKIRPFLGWVGGLLLLNPPTPLGFKRTDFSCSVLIIRGHD